MSKLPKSEIQTTLTPASQMAFAVAFCALAVAGIGAIANQWLSGWLAIGGMFGVGLFYIAIGVLNIVSNPPAFHEDESISNLSQRAARVDNLYEEPVSCGPVNGTEVVKSTDSKRTK